MDKMNIVEPAISQKLVKLLPYTIFNNPTEELLDILHFNDLKKFIQVANIPAYATWENTIRDFSRSPYLYVTGISHVIPEHVPVGNQFSEQHCPDVRAPKAGGATDKLITRIVEALSPDTTVRQALRLGLNLNGFLSSIGIIDIALLFNERNCSSETNPCRAEVRKLANGLVRFKMTYHSTSIINGNNRITYTVNNKQVPLLITIISFTIAPGKEVARICNLTIEFNIKRDEIYRMFNPIPEKFISVESRQLSEMASKNATNFFNAMIDQFIIALEQYSSLRKQTPQTLFLQGSIMAGTTNLLKDAEKTGHKFTFVNDIIPRLQLMKKFPYVDYEHAMTDLEMLVLDCFRRNYAVQHNIELEQVANWLLVRFLNETDAFAQSVLKCYGEIQQHYCNLTCGDPAIEESTLSRLYALPTPSPIDNKM